MNENCLTEAEIQQYIKPANPKTGVKAITEEFLRKVDLNQVRELKRSGEFLLDATTGKKCFKYDDFIPVRGSYAFKPSFAGEQVLLGREGRKLHFSNGRWFVGGC